jgi:GcrA cell cycle regulator
MDWTDASIQQLQELWVAGFSAREIAERLGEGATRNAVIGKANRMGLSKPTKSSITRRQKRETQEQEVQAAKQMPPGGATILTLTGSSCRWPVGHPGEAHFHFCGAKTTPGQPYCGQHARLAYQAPQPRDSRKRA